MYLILLNYAVTCTLLQLTVAIDKVWESKAYVDSICMYLNYSGSKAMTLQEFLTKVGFKLNPCREGGTGSTPQAEATLSVSQRI